MDSVITNIPGADQKQAFRGLRLLVVGEDVGLLTSRRAFLESLGYQVLVCSSHEHSAVGGFGLRSPESGNPQTRLA